MVDLKGIVSGPGVSLCRLRGKLGVEDEFRVVEILRWLIGLRYQICDRTPQPGWLRCHVRSGGVSTVSSIWRDLYLAAAMNGGYSVSVHWLLCSAVRGLGMGTLWPSLADEISVFYRPLSYWKVLGFGIVDTCAGTQYLP